MINTSRIVAFAATSVAIASFAFAPLAAARGPQSPVPGQPGSQNIVEIAVGVNAANGEFSYLLAAATCPGLDGAVAALLTGADNYTLFAPTDAAFIALQQTLIEAYDIDAQPSPALSCAIDDVLGQGTLFNVLAYHVTDGRRFSNSVFNRNAPKMVAMLNGQYVIANPNLTLTDIAGQLAGVAAPLVNINASNGVIHVIDTVLLPF